MAGERQTEPHQAADWRCECGDLNRGHEAFCYRCGAGQPDEPQTEPHQAEAEGKPWTCMTCGFIGDRQSCGNCGAESCPGAWVSETEVARLRAERDRLKTWQQAYAKGRAGLVEQADQDFARAEAAEARVAELEGNLAAEREQAAVEIEQLRQAQNRVAELEAERDRLKDESRIGWLERALAREQTLRAAAEDRIDRAVTERTAEVVSWMETVGDGSWWDAAQDVRHKFLAPTRTQEAEDRGATGHAVPPSELRDGFGGVA